MGRLNKEELARRDGMAYAYHLVKEKGIEALADRLTRNEKSEAPCKLSQKSVDEFTDAVKKATTSTVIMLGMAALHDEFGFGGTRLRRFAEKVRSYAECVVGNYVTFTDFKKEMWDLYKIDIDMFRNEHDLIVGKELK